MRSIFSQDHVEIMLFDVLVTRYIASRNQILIMSCILAIVSQGHIKITFFILLLISEIQNCNMILRRYWYDDKHKVNAYDMTPIHYWPDYLYVRHTWYMYWPVRSIVSIEHISMMSCILISRSIVSTYISIISVMLGISSIVSSDLTLQLCIHGVRCWTCD
jgi:hypothetical protein